MLVEVCNLCAAACGHVRDLKLDSNRMGLGGKDYKDRYMVGGIELVRRNLGRPA